MYRPGRRKAVLLAIAAWVVPAGLGASGADPATATRKPPARPFVDITNQAGVRHRHHKPHLDKKLDNIMPWMASVGASAAAVDYDKDGNIDLYVTNSRLGFPNRLFRNNGDGTFIDVAERVGVARANEEHGTSMDAVWGDYDNDGHLDLYIVKWGWNILYHANGDGTFTDVTDTAGVGDRGNGNAAIWFDYNDDGLLDLYVGNYFRYVDLWNLDDTRQMHESFETARDGGANVLYRNNGDGTFTNVAAELGVDDPGWTLDVGAADYDNDGDQDLVLANDFGQDCVFRTNADGTFTNVTHHAIGRDTHKGMNVDFGDYNNDGWLDLYITNIWTEEYVQEGNQLYRNMGDGTFADVSFEADVYDGGWCWAGRFWDYDNDGDLDIAIANGYISGNPKDEYFRKLALTVTQPGFDPVDARNWPRIGDSTFAGYEPSRVWRNEGSGTFREVAAELGLADVRDGRGLAIADFDNDGDLDLYISNQGQEGVLYRNDLQTRNHWIQIELEGTNCNRDAIGTRVTVTTGDLSQIREMNGGNGDHSQNPYRLHVGLGGHGRIDSIEIRWPTGYIERHENIAADQLLKFTERTPKALLEQRARLKAAEGETADTGTAAAEGRARATGGGREEAPSSLTWEEEAEFKRAYVDGKRKVREAPDDPQARYEFALLLDRYKRASAALGELERAVALAPDVMLYANTYRSVVRAQGDTYYDRSINFFEELAETHPRSIMVRLNQALAYVDKMPSPQLGIVSQGMLSNKSIAELEYILEELDPRCWAAKFVRGMNHLHWPRKLRHAPLAIQDFTELIALQRSFPGKRQREHFALAYVGLGDACIKNRDDDIEESLRRARDAWTQGLEEHPKSKELQQRLELLARSADELIDYVKNLRGLGDPVDTDLARVWVADEATSRPPAAKRPESDK